MLASMGQRLLAPIAEVRRDEVANALLMFAYSFLAMSSYNIVKPITRSQFISDLGADNLPYVLLGVGLLIGVVMTAYTWLTSWLPRRWGLPIIQGLMVVTLVVFWVLFQTPQEWVSVAFFFFGKILGLLLISQFWTLANLVYDPRQAKRLFGFIGGGAPLGGIAGSALLTGYATTIGTTNLLLYSAVLLALCGVVVATIIAREGNVQTARAAGPGKQEGVGLAESFALLRQSRHVKIIALVISFAAIGASIIEQQLNMAAAADKGQQATDAITAFLGQVQLWMSSIAFVIQIWATSRIHRLLGIGFALLILPVALGSTAVLMLFVSALWAPGLARITDQSLRYTVDKTTREILFLPLSDELKYRAKSFVDVTVDRVAQGFTAVLLLVLIKPWGLGLDWQRLGLASLVIMSLWIVFALRARRGYLDAFRRSIEEQRIAPADVRLQVADLSTVETLMTELAHPDERRVLYAIDVLESLDKQNLVTPLLLHHESAPVRARALAAIGHAPSDVSRDWVPRIQGMLRDDDDAVRAAALEALARLQGQRASDAIRPYLTSDDPRVAATAAAVLAGTDEPDDVSAAEDVLERLVDDTGEGAAPTRCQVARALAASSSDRLRRLLVTLLHDPDPGVAAEAMRSVAASGASDFIFVPTLVSLLRHRRLKAEAREVLVSYGEPVLDVLAHFLNDPGEDRWVRRHLPATIARIPCQKAMDILVGALEDADGFLRYKVIEALGRLRREHSELTFDAEPVEKRALAEARHYYTYLGLHHNLFVEANLPADSLLARSLEEKVDRTRDRIFELLGLLYPWDDIAAARWALEHGDARASTSAAELLDNTLDGTIRRRIMPILEDLPLDERVRKGNVFLKTRRRDVEETLLYLINDDDPVVAAAAINLVRTRGVWELADDIEYILEHRDARDWYVFEAASMALADHRMPPERRRELWQEPLPTIEMADRLRGVPMFAAVWADELVRIAEAGSQVRHDEGRTLYRAGTIPERLEFLLDGLMTGRAEQRDDRRIEPPAAVAFEEVLEERPMVETIRTADACVSLALTTTVCRTLLADNTSLVQGLFRMLLERAPERDGRLVQSPRTSVDDGDGDRSGGAAGARDAARRPPGATAREDRLSPIETMIALQRIDAFAALDGEELRALAAIAREVPMDADARLFAPSDPAALWVIVSGAVSLESDAAPTASARAGDAIGVYEVLAGVPLDRSAHVIRPGVALRVGRDDLFDLLAQRGDLLRQMFRSLFRVGARGEPAASADAAQETSDSAR